MPWRRDVSPTPHLKGLWSVDFTDVVSLGGNAGVAFRRVANGAADFEPEYLAFLSVGLSLVRRLDAFPEVYGLMNHGTGVGRVADGGFTFLAAPWLQLDMHAGVCVTLPSRGFDLDVGAIFLL